MKKYSILLILIMSCISLSYAQTTSARIKRETLCGSCGVGQKINSGGTNFIIESTAGSCPGCSTLHGNGDPGDTYIRQGFEQPVKDPNGNNGGGGGTDPNGCTTILVSFDIKEKVTACGTYYDFEYTGTVEKGYTYSWDFGADASPSTSTELNPGNVAFSVIGTKTIKLSVKKDICTTTTDKSKLLNVTGIGFSAKAQTKDVLCFGKNTGEAKLVAVGGTAPFAFKWSNGVTSDFLANLKKGKYEYTVTDSKNCLFKSFATVGGPDTSIVITPKVVDESCTGTKDGSIKLTVKGGTAPYNYTWVPTGNTANQTNLSAGEYKVTVTDANACVNNATFTLKEFCKNGGDNIDNTITPNGDGKNDVWVVNGLDKFPNNEVFIFNRWGSIVFSKKPYDNSWYGQNSGGAELPSGAYYYLIKLNDPDNNTISGAITIIR